MLGPHFQILIHMVWPEAQDLVGFSSPDSNTQLGWGPTDSSGSTILSTQIPSASSCSLTQGEAQCLPFQQIQSMPEINFCYFIPTSQTEEIKMHTTFGFSHSAIILHAWWRNSSEHVHVPLLSESLTPSETFIFNLLFCFVLFLLHLFLVVSRKGQLWVITIVLSSHSSISPSL